MSLHRIRKSFTFEAAHQLEHAYTAPCHECIHGHSYTVELYLTAKELDPDQMVLDFGRLASFKSWVMGTWDHGILVHENKRPHLQPLIDAGVLKKEKVSFYQVNPTAEFMAKELFVRLSANLLQQVGLGNYTDSLAATRRDLRVEKVRVHETSTGWAEFSVENQ